MLTFLIIITLYVKYSFDNRENPEEDWEIKYTNMREEQIIITINAKII